MRIDPKDIVVGDVIHLQLGDRVPADLRIIHTKELKLEMSSLTGESKAITMVVKAASDNPLECRNIAFSSSLVMQGSGHGVAIRTANETMIGTIAALAAGSGKVEESLLQKEIHRFVNIIALFALCSALTLFVIGISRGVSFLTCFVNGFIVVLVANIPEGLAATVTSCLAVVAKRMSAKNVLVKRIDIIESLGACSIIASDKTGTLTQNRMTVENLFYSGAVYNVHAGGTSVILDSIQERATTMMVKQESYTARKRRSQEIGRSISPGQTFTISSFKALLSGSSSSLNWEMFSCHAKLLTIAGVNNQAAFEEKDGERQIVRGDATDAGLLRYSDSIYPVFLARQSFVTKFEIPFNSTNKYAAVVVSCAGSSEHLIWLKGAPERIIARCDKYAHERGERPITETYTETFEDAYHRFGVCGERVIGFAYARISAQDSYNGIDIDTFLDDVKFTFVGLISLVDPPRPGVAEAISKCRSASIKVAMVTGDHPLTAEAIARKIGIITMPTSHEITEMTGGDMLKHWNAEECHAVVVTGAEAESFTDSDWDVVVRKKEIVFARTSPQMKLKFVEKLRGVGEIVAVTGDGVNDSPALKAAHIGIAMGSPSSSDVAREAADIVLLDDNFASIEAAVAEGRSVFDNLTKSIMYTLAHLTPQLVPVFFNLALGMPLAMNGIMILSIDLLTEQGPAISLVYETAESDIMTRKPRNPTRDHLITKQTLFYSYILSGLTSSLICFMAYALVFKHYGISLRHLLFATDDGYFAGPPYVSLVDGTYPPLFTAGSRIYDAVEQYKIYREASSAWYLTLILNQVWNLFCVRTQRTSIFTQGFFSNEVAIFGVVCSITIMMMAVYVPELQTPDLFASARPLGQSWLPTFVFAVWIFGTSEFIKRRLLNFWDTKS
jgi:sodium/potassium-transporting ATPase subunit alpha